MSTGLVPKPFFFASLRFDAGYAKMGLKEGCCQFCFIMSAVAVPLLFFFGFLCSSGSPMIEIKDEMKADAGKGCYMAGVLYLVTLGVSYGIVNGGKDAEAREVTSSDYKPM